MQQEKWPTISVIIPTLNSARTLEKCLTSIIDQDYPKEKMEVIIADGGSEDRTLNIIRSLKVSRFKSLKVFANPLKTGEAGKAVGLRQAHGELAALIDSDNVLPENEWLKKMIEPFHDREIIGSEPWAFSYRKNDSFINRYCALIGVNDPYCYFAGIYDKKSVLSGKWTGLNLKQEDNEHYLKVKIEGGILPTIGANGTIWITEILKKAVGKNDYLFDTDIPYILTVQRNYFWFAKVKTSIIHLYCQKIKDFYRKQRRRARDFFYLESEKKRNETYQRQTNRQLYFIIATVTIFPLLIQAIRGFIKKPDPAWFFHPLACLMTLWIYGSETILVRFGQVRIERHGWRQ